MKKYLAMLLCMFALNTNVQAYTINGSVGVNVDAISYEKQKATVSTATVKFKSVTPVMWGVGGDLNVALPKNFYAGVDLNIGFMSKKAGFNASQITTNTLAKALTGHDTVDEKDVPGLVKLLENKSLLNKKHKTLFSIDAHVGYKFKNKAIVQLGLGWAHSNQKYKKTALTDTSAEVVAVKGGGTAANIANAWTALVPSKIRKLKKNGLEIKGLVGYNFTPRWGATASVSYLTNIKAWRGGVGVRANF